MSDADDRDLACGRLADALASGTWEESDAPGLDADDLSALRLVADAFKDAVALSPEEIDAVLADLPDGDDALPPPALPADYELIDELGRGGMGVVYRARQASLDRTVAIKVLLPGELLLGTAIRRFEKEARALAKLRHRHIVAIHEVGQTDGHVYFTMDLIEGRSLEQLIAAGEMTPSRTVRLLRQVTSAIAYTHGHGLVHRDLKPANILVDDEGNAFVTDFGLAMEVDAPAGLTRTGQVIGTPAYMSPEQARGDTAQIGEATDVHALGVLLYECLTGKRPFSGDSPAEQLYSVIHADPALPRRIDRRVPTELETICTKAMAKRPEDRYASAKALLEDLDRFEEGRPILAQPATATQRTAKFLWRQRVPVASAMLSAAVLLLVFFVVFVPRMGASQDVLIAEGDALLEAGSADAALRLFEAAARDAEPPRELFDRMAEARIEQARDLCCTGRAPEAVTLLRATRDEGVRRFGEEPFGDRTMWPLEATIDWELAVASALVDGRESSTFRPAHRGLVTRAQWLEPSDIWRRANDAILDRMPDGLDDPLHARHHLAKLHLWGLLTCSQPDPAVPSIFEWLARRGDTAAAHLPAIVGVISEQSEVTASMAWREMIPHLDAYSGAATEQVLAAAVADGQRPERDRRAAAFLLGAFADLPVCLSREFLPRTLGRDSFDADRILATWEQVADEERVAAYGHRLRIAVAEFAHAEKSWPPSEDPEVYRRTAPASERTVLVDWFRRHAGELAPSSILRADQDHPSWATFAADWIEEHRDEDPRELLSTSIGRKSRPHAAGVARLVESMRRDREKIGWTHNLAALVADEDVPRPVWPPASPSVRPEERWLRALSTRGVIARRLRTARVEFADGAWRLVPGVSGVHEIDAGQPVEITYASSLDGVLGSSIGYTLPGTISHPPPPPTREHQLTAQTALQRDGMMLEFPTSRNVTRWTGHVGSTSRTGSEGHVGFVMSPDVPLFGYSSPDPFRNEFTLALAWPGDGSEDEWALEEWQRRLTADLSRLADLADEISQTHPRFEFYNRYQQTVANLLAIAMSIADENAQIPLARLQEFSSFNGRTHWNDSNFSGHVRLMLPLARLRAGDATFLERADLDALLDEAEREDICHTAMGRDYRYWARLAITTDVPEIRELAFERLRGVGITPDVARDLAAAESAGRIKLPDWTRGYMVNDGWLAVVLEGWYWFAGAGLLLLSALVAVICAARAGSRSRRVVPAMVAVLLGIVITALHVWLGEFDVLHPAVGCMCAAVGCGVLARELRDGAARRAAYAFGVGAIASLPLLVGMRFEFLDLLAGASVFAGVCAIPLMLHGPAAARRAMRRATDGRPPLPPGTAEAARWTGSVVIGLSILVGLAGVGFDVKVVIGAVLALAAALVLGWAGRRLLDAASAARAHRVPTPFLLLYALPMACGYALGIWARYFHTGEPLSYELTGWAPALILLVGSLTVGWVLLEFLERAVLVAGAMRRRPDVAPAARPLSTPTTS